VLLTNANINTYTGTVINAGTLQIGSDAVLGTVTASAATNITFTGGTLLAGVDGLSLNASRTIFIASNATATINDGGYNLAINGTITGTNGSCSKPVRGP